MEVRHHLHLVGTAGIAVAVCIVVAAGTEVEAAEQAVAVLAVAA